MPDPPPRGSGIQQPDRVPMTRIRVAPEFRPYVTTREDPLATSGGGGKKAKWGGLDNVFSLLMGPFGSDQSRHVDDFGAKKHNFDDFDAKKSSFGRLFDEKRGYGHLFIDGRIYL